MGEKIESFKKSELTWSYPPPSPFLVGMQKIKVKARKLALKLETEVMYTGTIHSAQPPLPRIRI